MSKIRAHAAFFSVAMLTGVLVMACGGESSDEGVGGANGSGGSINVGSANGESGAGSSDSGSTGSGSTGSGSTGSGSTGSGSTGSGATAGSDALPDGVCNNGEDDDADGFIDGFDPECTGPADNDEGTFATGIPGDNRDPKWQDCFFDGNSGAGDDGCRYHTDCLYGTIDQEDGNCQLTQKCVDYCQALTPNGCDCFGCCTVQGEDGRSVDILMQPTCSLSELDDTGACPRCTKSADCGNTCGRCELCLGKTEADLPEDCTPEPPPPPPGTPPPPPPAEPPPTYTCEGSTVCSDAIACPGGQYCQLGCCRAVVR